MLVITIIVMLIKEAAKVEQTLESGQGETEGKTYASTDDYMEGMEKCSWYYCKEDKTKSNRPTAFVSDGTIVIPVGSKVNYTIENRSYKINTSKGIGTGSIYDNEQKTCILTGDKTTITTVDLKDWFVLGVGEDGLLELVSEYSSDSDDIDKKLGVDGKIYLRGQEGYANGPDELDTVCNNLYGTGTGASYARSIKVKDLEKLTGIDVTDYSKNNKPYEYGLKYTYKIVTDGSENKIYVYSDGVTCTIKDREGITDEKDDTKKWYYTGFNKFTYCNKYGKDWLTLGVSKDSKRNTINEVQIKPTYYGSWLGDWLQEDDPLYKELSEDCFWLASRSVDSNIEYATFSVACCIGSSFCANNAMFLSIGESNCAGYGLRPVVSLSSNVSLKLVDGVYEMQ